MKKTWRYIEVLLVAGFVAMGFYFIISGWVSGEIYWPTYMSRIELASLTEDPKGYYIALILWIGITVTMMFFTVQEYKKLKK